MNESALHELPRGWVWTKLGEIAEKIVDGTHFTPKYVSSGVPFISVKDIRNSKISFDDCRYISQDEHETLIKRCNPEYNDVLITKSGTIGRTAVIKTNKIFSLFVSVALIKPFKNYLDSDLISLILENYINNIDISQSIKGGVIKNFHLEDLKLVDFPLPPLPEQRRIVTKLEELFTRLDAGVSELKKTQAQLKRYRQSVLKAACEGKLVPTEAELAKAEGHTYEPADVLLACILEENREKRKGIKYKGRPDAPDSSELPDGWEYVRLGEISHAIGGYAFKSSDFKENGMYQVIKIGNVKMGYLRLDEKPSFIDNVNSQIMNKYILDSGDLVITLTGTRKKRDYGFVAMVKNEKNLLLNQRLAVMRFFKPLIPEYFQYALRTEHFQNNFFKHETGNVGQGNVSMNAIISETIAIPPLAEQRRIVAEVERRLSIADAVEKTVTQSLAQAQRLRQSILKKAFEGRLVAQDASDEPAGMLLEKIRQQKQIKEKNNKTTKRKTHG